MFTPTLSRAVLGAVVAALTVATLPAAEFVGRLEAVPRTSTKSYSRLQAAPTGAAARLPEPVPAGAQLWTLARPMEIKGRSYEHLVVQLAGKDPVLWLDRDGNGRFEIGEQWVLGGAEKKATFTLPWNNGIYREFPIEVMASYSQATGNDAAKEHELSALVYNFNVFMDATVDFEGRPLHITFAVRPWESAVNLVNARILMDANFNGRIEADLGEAENPGPETRVFRVAGRYVAVRSVDMATGAVVLEERPASDYTRFDALPGQQMPDFTFTTLAGEMRKLSDLRGKYVLLDFWGTWCGPCIGEMKELDPVYEKYHPRGFEVIGLNMEKTSGGVSPEVYAADEKKVRAFIAKAGHKWLQATQQSIERVALDIIHVNSYPTCILLDPEGKVVSRNARGEELKRLLAERLPDPS